VARGITHINHWKGLVTSLSLDVNFFLAQSITNNK
jgi:hypothetical protein